MNPRLISALCLLMAVAGHNLSAAPSDSLRTNVWQGDVSAIELPFSTIRGGQWPSMAQSLSVTSSLFELSGSGVAWATDQINNPLGRFAARAGLEGIVTLLAGYLPGGATWLHEEFHRAVLSNRGIASYNTLYDFNPDMTNISVSHIGDDALAALKANHSAEFVRLSSAGYESQVCLVDNLMEQKVFEGARFVEIPALYQLISNTFYLAFCSTPAADAEIRAFNQTETTIDKRDAVGWDYTSWTYDLHRPDEPYNSRGLHPSGVGIDRYIRWGELTPEEQRYLRSQIWLSLANFVRPSLYGLPPAQLQRSGKPIGITGGLEHHLTPFGFQLGCQAAVVAGPTRFTAALSANASSHMVLPEVECGLVNIPLGNPTSRFSWSPRMRLWLQPDHLRFDSRTAVPGAFTSQRVGMRLVENAGLYVDLSLKTTGWVAGTVDLESAASVSVGAEWSIR